MGAPHTRKLQRTLALRPRVVDCLSDMGHGDPERGRQRFAEHAIWCAQQRGIRVWNDNNTTLIKAALHSLANLLGDYGNRQTKTGVPQNAGWVLDIWEVACDDWFRVRPATPDEVEQMAELEAASPAATATLVGPPERKLSSRILDAYMNRDSDAMLDALHELEQKGL